MIKGKIMVFVFDLDDTICDTNGYSEKYISDFFAKNNLPFVKVANETRFAEAKFSWNMETALEWYKTYGDEMMLHFPCHPYAIEAINALHDAGHKIVIATARATDWHTKPEEITFSWLEKIGLKYDKIYIGRVDKENVCKEENADVFIDDDLKITDRVSQVFSGMENKYVFLSTTDYNKNLSTPAGVKRMKNFEEFAKMFNVKLSKEKQ